MKPGNNESYVSRCLYLRKRLCSPPPEGKERPKFLDPIDAQWHLRNIEQHRKDLERLDNWQDRMRWRNEDNG